VRIGLCVLEPSAPSLPVQIVRKFIYPRFGICILRKLSFLSSYFWRGAIELPSSCGPHRRRGMNMHKSRDCLRPLCSYTARSVPTATSAPILW